MSVSTLWKIPAAACVLKTCALFCVCDILQQTCLVRIEYRALPGIYDETENATLSLFYKVEFEFQGKVGQALCEFLLLSHFVKQSAPPSEMGIMIPFCILAKGGSEWIQFVQDHTSARWPISPPWRLPDPEGSLLKLRAWSKSTNHRNPACRLFFLFVLQDISYGLLRDNANWN